MLETFAAIATVAVGTVIVFYLRRQAHYSDALERQLVELRRQIEGLPQSMERLMESRQVRHPVFRCFERYEGPGRPGYVPSDFLGSFVREDYTGTKTKYIPWVRTEYPPPDENIFAWIDLLEAIVGAREKFRMLELGAAYGCWSVRSALAARKFGLDVELTCVEPEPEHFRWIEQHMLANSVPISSVRMIYAALSAKPGRTLFYVNSPFYRELQSGDLVWTGNRSRRRRGCQLGGHLSRRTFTKHKIRLQSHRGARNHVKRAPARR